MVVDASYVAVFFREIKLNRSSLMMKIFLYFSCISSIMILRMMAMKQYELVPVRHVKFYNAREFIIL